VEQNGIVFIDEIDKSPAPGNAGAPKFPPWRTARSLPLVEGTTVNTKYGMIKTDHILFIGSGAFHLSKPSDLIRNCKAISDPALNSRSFSWRISERILTPPMLPHAAYQAAAGNGGSEARIPPDGIRRMAEIAWQVNERWEHRRTPARIPSSRAVGRSLFEANRPGIVIVIDAATDAR